MYLKPICTVKKCNFEYRNKHFCGKLAFVALLIVIPFQCGLYNEWKWEKLLFRYASASLAIMQRNQP